MAYSTLSLLFLFSMNLSGNSLKFPKESDPDIKKFVPAGYVLTKEATGDLNQDGLEDKVLVLEKSPNESRVLVILFKDITGKFSYFTHSEKLILPMSEGDAFGDPCSSVTVEKGLLVINHNAGKLQRWGMRYSFQFQSGHFYLTSRMTVSLSLNSSREARKNEYFPQSGVNIETMTDASGKEKKIRLKMKKRPHLLLSEFKGYFQKHYLVYQGT
ncbi:MAG TPA: hypothetical protein PKK94_19005, partial [Leptospiraceae bacterium]|nr:hypothetical protein [Leptospiraceae bacterium]